MRLPCSASRAFDAPAFRGMREYGTGLSPATFAMPVGRQRVVDTDPASTEVAFNGALAPILSTSAKRSGCFQLPGEGDGLMMYDRRQFRSGLSALPTRTSS